MGRNIEDVVLDHVAPSHPAGWWRGSLLCLDADGGRLFPFQTNGVRMCWPDDSPSPRLSEGLRYKTIALLARQGLCPIPELTVPVKQLDDRYMVVWRRWKSAPFFESVRVVRMVGFDLEGRQVRARSYNLGWKPLCHQLSRVRDAGALMADHPRFACDLSAFLADRWTSWSANVVRPWLEVAGHEQG